MQILKPETQRGEFTTWRGIDPQSGQPMRISRYIDIDGDEHWSVSIQRNETWTPAPKLAGRNRETRLRIMERMQAALYELEDIPSPEPHCDRKRMNVIRGEELRHEHYTLEELRGMYNAGCGVLGGLFK